jgi:hypothetical protein
MCPSTLTSPDRRALKLAALLSVATSCPHAASDHLSAFREQSAHNGFLALLLCKHLSVTLAYVDFGTIATHPSQQGLYLACKEATDL